jgi:molybdopterin-binding protein
MRLGARNHLHGGDEGGEPGKATSLAQVALPGGQTPTAVTTPEAAEGLAPAPGSR